MAEIWPRVLLTAYLVVTGARMLFGDVSVDTVIFACHVALLTVTLASLFTRVVPKGLGDWLPLIAVPFLYVELPNVIAAAGHTGVFDEEVIRWERAMFGGAPSAEWARTWPSLLLSESLHAAYAAYYPIIYSVPTILYATGRRRDFAEGVFVLLLSFAVCFLAFTVFPVEGPRYRHIAEMPGAVRAGVLWLLERGSSHGTAFPSSHVAVAVTQAILATRYFGARGALLWIPTTGLALGAVYGGFHYAVDAVAGVVVAAFVATIGLLAVRWIRRAPVPQANATAPI
jgi:membrane-associated phospholipid phosphatase